MASLAPAPTVEFVRHGSGSAPQDQYGFFANRVCGFCRGSFPRNGNFALAPCAVDLDSVHPTTSNSRAASRKPIHQQLVDPMKYVADHRPAGLRIRGELTQDPVVIKFLYGAVAFFKLHQGVDVIDQFPVTACHRIAHR